VLVIETARSCATIRATASMRRKSRNICPFSRIVHFEPRELSMQETLRKVDSMKSPIHRRRRRDKVDLTKSAYDNDMIHNRCIRISVWRGFTRRRLHHQTYDWTAASSRNNDSADDVRHRSVDRAFLSGPIGVKGAERRRSSGGRLLDVGPLKESLWGFKRLLLQEERRRLPDRSFSAGQKSIWTSRASTPPRATFPRQLCRPDPSPA